MRRTVCAFLIVLTCFPTLGYASSVMETSQEYMKTRIVRDGIPFLDSVYAAFKAKSKASQNAYVRARLYQLSKRLEDEYATSTLTRKIEQGSRKSGEKIFLTKDWDLFAWRNETVRSIRWETSSVSAARKTTPWTSYTSNGDEKKKTSSNRSTNTKENTSPSLQEIKKPTPSPEIYRLQNGRIDISQLQHSWRDRVNEVRATRNVRPLTLEPVLHKTAADWSVAMLTKWTADHKRTPQSGYYSYGELEKRFAKKWVRFENVSRATFTENVWYATISCSQQDCTQAALDWLRSIFDFFRAEEGKAYDAHRESMIHPLFGIVGLWIAVDEEKKILYVTVHYGTELKENILLAQNN